MVEKSAVFRFLNSSRSFQLGDNDHFQDHQRVALFDACYFSKTIRCDHLNIQKQRSNVHKRYDPTISNLSESQTFVREPTWCSHRFRLAPTGRICCALCVEAEKPVGLTKFENMEQLGGYSLNSMPFG